MSQTQTPQLHTQEAFRVPNSILQGLTTTTSTEMNAMSAFTTTTLLGLLAMVDQQHPEREVRTTVSKILDILEVSRNVAHAVDRAWTNQDGQVQEKKYSARRFSPRQVQKVNEALLELYQYSVVIPSSRGPGKTQREARNVHVLDMFGYAYQDSGEELDLYNLPLGFTKRNIGTPERPVLKVKRRKEDSEVDASPVGVIFRFSPELVNEINGAPGTIKYTLFARQVFDLLKKLQKRPTTLRLLLLVLRQRNACFRRSVNKLIRDLGWDTTHPARAYESFEAALDELKGVGIIDAYITDLNQDRVEITPNRTWFKQPQETPPPCKEQITLDCSFSNGDDT